MTCLLQRLRSEHHWALLGLVLGTGVSVLLASFAVVLTAPRGEMLAAPPNFTGTARSPSDSATGVAVDSAVYVDATAAIDATSVGTGATAQTSGTSQTLFDVDFIDVNTGWAVGGSGTILKTTNGGLTWSAQTSGVTFPLLNVHAVDANTAYATIGCEGTCAVLGVDPIVITTTNGGTTWVSATTATIDTNILRALWCTDANTCWVGGNGSRIFKTSNGGSSWTNQSPITGSPVFEDIACADASTCWAVGGESGSTVYSYATTNGGSSWVAQSNPEGNPSSQQLQAVTAASTSVAWRSGGGGAKILEKTTNGGSSWTAQSGHGLLALALDAASTSVVFAVGGSGAAARTTDGSTWSSVTTGVSVTLNGVSVVDANTAWMVGSSGTILKYSIDTVRLQANTGNTSAGAAAGSNLCTSVTLGTNASSVANARITCAHANLSNGTWYTVTIVGGSSGIRSTDKTDNTMTSNVTVVFQSVSTLAVATQPTDLDAVELRPGQASGSALIGFAVTGTNTERLRSASVTVSSVTGSSIDNTHITADLVVDSSNASDDGLSSTLDDYASGSPSDNAANDDRIATQAGSGITLGAAFTLTTSANAHTADKGDFPSSMTGRGSHEYFIVVRLVPGTPTTDLFTVTLNSATCETSAGESTLPCTLTAKTTTTVGPIGWAPDAASATITTATVATDLGVRGIKGSSSNVPAIPVIGFALTTSSTDTLERVTVRVDSVEGSTVTADDFLTVRLLKDSATTGGGTGDAADPANDWVDESTLVYGTDDYSGTTPPSDTGNVDDTLASRAGSTFSVGESFSLVVGTAAQTAAKHRLPSSMTGRGSHEYLIAVEGDSSSLTATDTFTVTLVSMKCRNPSGTLVSCGSETVTASTIALDTTSPTITATSVSDSATGVATNVALTMTASERLQPSNNTYDLSRVIRLRRCTGSDTSTAAAACATIDTTNLCASTTLGANGSGNPARVVTCGHAALTDSTWYTFVTAAIDLLEDAVGNTQPTATQHRFQTLGGAPLVTDATPPGPVRNSAATASHPSTGPRVTLTWTDSADADLQRVLVFRNSGGDSAVDGSSPIARVPAGTQQLLDTSNLTVGSTYTYVLRASDGTNVGEGVRVVSTAVPALGTQTETRTETQTTTTTRTTTQQRQEARDRLAGIFPPGYLGALTIAERTAIEDFLASGGTTSATTSRTIAERTELLRTFAQIYQRAPRGTIDFTTFEVMADHPAAVEFAAHLRQLPVTVTVFSSVHGRLPSDGATGATDVDQDWRAMRVLGYGVSGSTRDTSLERSVLRSLVGRAVVFVVDGRSVSKPAGVAPPAEVLLQAFRLVRACTYGSSSRCPIVPPPPEPPTPLPRPAPAPPPPPPPRPSRPTETPRDAAVRRPPPRPSLPRR